MHTTGVYYDIVGEIPKASLEIEQKSTLALMAARQSLDLSDKMVDCLIVNFRSQTNVFLSILG